MSWRDNLKTASFKGVEFFIDSSDYEIGRKNIFHDFPFRDDAELEDQGQLADVFSVTGYVIQNKTNNFDYFLERDKLINILKEKGAGKLTHTYFGDKNVALQGSARVSERFSEGGIARFQMSFKEVKLEQPFSIGFHPISAMDTIAEDSSNRLLDAFNELMQVGADLQKLSNDMTAGMQSIISKIRQLKSLPGSIISTATGLVLSATALADEVLSSPCDLAKSITGGFDSFLFAAGMLENTVNRDILGSCSGRIQNPDDAARSSDDLSQTEGVALTTAAVNMLTFGTELPEINVTSTASAADQANKQANINLFRCQALIVACRMAVRTNFVSQDDAQALLSLMTKLIDAYLDYLGDEAGNESLANQGINYNNDEIYQSVQQLKTGLKKSMDQIGASLSKIVNYEVGPDVLSSLVLSYDRYEDLNRSQEITDRNPLLILNPCFIPNGKTINILSE
jgi:prophage DNA circulation protein